MRLVYHQPGVVFFAQLHHLRQVNDVAVHAEDRVGDDHFRRAVGHVLEHRLEVRHIVVFETAELRARHQTPIHDGGVVQFIRKHVIAASHQRGHNRQVGGVARTVGDGRLGMFEVGDRLFEFSVDRQRACQRADAVRPRPELVHCGFGGRVDARVVDQSQVAVRGVHPHLAPVHAHLHPRQDLLHRLVVEIKIVRLEHRNAFRECLNAAGNGIVCFLEIHARLLERDCPIISDDADASASHLWGGQFRLNGDSNSIGFVRLGWCDAPSLPTEPTASLLYLDVGAGR